MQREQLLSVLLRDGKSNGISPKHPRPEMVTSTPRTEAVQGVSEVLAQVAADVASRPGPRNPEPASGDGGAGAVVTGWGTQTIWVQDPSP